MLLRAKFKLLLATHLVQLEAHQPSDDGRGRRDSRNDLARDLLRVMSACGLDAVVERTQVSSGGDEVDVVVGVIILLELDGRQAVACER